MADWYHVLTQKIQTFAISKIGFWSGRLHDFNGVEGIAEPGSVFTESSRKKWVVIVGRDYYFETVKDYPVGIRSDLKGILKNEVLNLPHEGLRFSKIDRLSEKAHRVTTWLVKNEVLADLPFRPYLLVPETACVDLSESNDGLLLERLGQGLYVNSTVGGLVSRLQSLGSEGSKSVQGKILNSLGMAGSASWTRLTELQTAKAFYSGFVSQWLKTPFLFAIEIDTLTVQNMPWRRAFGLAGICFLAYLMISSMYLVTREGWLDYRLSASRAEAEVALQSRRRLGQIGALDKSLSTLTASKAPYWVTWPIFLDLVALDNIMVANRTTKDGVSFIGRAENAADTLEVLKDDPRIESAEFLLPIRSVSNLEAYTIGVILKQVVGEELVSIGEPFRVKPSNDKPLLDDPLGVSTK